MMIEAFVRNCDSCGEDADGIACLAQGATGRWCEVLSFCASCADEQGLEASHSFADATVEADMTGRCDFWHLHPLIPRPSSKDERAALNSFR